MSQPNLLAELRNNARLRVGIWLIVTILAVYVLMLVNDYAHKLTLDYREIVGRLNRLESITKQTGWTQRAIEARAMRVQMEDKLWTATTKGLAQANLQAWLDSEIKSATIEDARLKVEPALDVPKYATLWQVTAQIEGIFTPLNLDKLLLKMGEHPQWLIVDRLEIHRTQSSRFTLVVIAYFQAPQINPS